jgi:hypothetical protein
MGCFGVVSIAPSDPGVDGAFAASGLNAVATSSAAATRQASRTTFVSMTQVKSLPWWPPVRRPEGPLKSCVIMFPASSSDMFKTAARLARACGETLATNNLPSCWCPFAPFVCPFAAPFVPLCASQGARKDEYVSRVVRTSVWDCSDTSTASALVTHPEHARQSVSDIEAGGGGCAAAAFSSVVTSYGF